MSISRRGFLRMTAATAAGAALTGCGGKAPGATSSATSTMGAAPPPSASGTLTIWAFQGTFEGLKTQVGRFNQKHPNVKVDLKPFGYDDVHTNLLNAIVAGTGAPDLCAIDVLRLTQYVDGLADLSLHRAQYEDQFVPPVLDLGSYRGKFYGLVTDSEPMGLLYRKDLWDKYGIKEEDINTWADLALAGEKVNRDSQGKVFLYAQSANDANLYEVLALEQGFGGYYFDETDSKVIVDDPKLIEAVEVLKHLWDGKGVLHNPDGGWAGDEMTVLLKSGKVASQIVGPAWYPETLTQTMPELSGKWRLMRAPAIKATGARVGYQYPTIYVIPQQSKHQDLAWELEVMGLTGAGARALFENTHILPAYAPLLDDELKPQADKYFGGQKTFTLWDAIARDAPKISFGAGFTEAQQILGNHLQKILTGKKSPEDGMREAAQEIRSKLKKD